MTPFPLSSSTEVCRHSEVNDYLDDCWRLHKTGGCGGIRVVAVLVWSLKVTWSNLTFNIMVLGEVFCPGLEGEVTTVLFDHFCWITDSVINCHIKEKKKIQKRVNNLHREAEVRNLSFIKIQGFGRKRHWQRKCHKPSEVLNGNAAGRLLPDARGWRQTRLFMRRLHSRARSREAS